MYFPLCNSKLKLYLIRILSDQAEENGVFLVWGNAKEHNNDGPRDILSFTYNYGVFHVYLDIQTMPRSNNCSDVGPLSYLEIGNHYST